MREGEAHSLIAAAKDRVQPLGGTLQEDKEGGLEQRQHAQENHGGDEEGADGVSVPPPKELEEERGDNDANAAKRVGQDVQEHALEKGVLVGILRILRGALSISRM